MNKKRILNFLKIKAKKNRTSNILYCFYDFDLHPISFDVSYFLIACELTRQEKKLEGLHIVFMPSKDIKKRPVPENYDKVIDLNSRMFRMKNICFQLPWLLPTVRGITFGNSWEDCEELRKDCENIYPQVGNYTPHHADYFQKVLAKNDYYKTENWGFQASKQARRYAQKWLSLKAGGRRSICISLRQYAVDCERNSQLDQWAIFAKWVTERGFFPFIIPDTDHINDLATSPLRSFAIFESAAWLVDLRMAIYESAWLNMFVNTGPNSLALLSGKCKYLFFKIILPEVPLTSENFLKWLGFSPPDQPNFCGKAQKWFWDKNDSFENLKDEFQKIERFC